MKKLLIIVSTLAALFIGEQLVSRVHAAEYNTGTITSADGGSFNNANTATTFTLPPSHRYAFWCSAAVYYNWTTTSSGTVTSTTGVPVAANTLQDTSSGIRLIYLNIIPQSASVMSCYVFDVAAW